MPIVVISMLISSLIESLIILPNHLSHVPEGHATTRGPAATGRTGAAAIVSPAESAAAGPARGAARVSTWCSKAVETGPLVVRRPRLYPRAGACPAGAVHLRRRDRGGAGRHIRAGGRRHRAVHRLPQVRRQLPQGDSPVPQRHPGAGDRRGDPAHGRRRGGTAPRAGRDQTACRRCARSSARWATSKSGGRGPQQAAVEHGGNIGYVFVELVDGELRDESASEELAARRGASGSAPIPGVEEVKFAAGDSGPSGKPIEFQLVGADIAELEAVTEACKARLVRVRGRLRHRRQHPAGQARASDPRPSRGRGPGDRHQRAGPDRPLRPFTARRSCGSSGAGTRSS